MQQWHKIPRPKTAAARQQANKGPRTRRQPRLKIERKSEEFDQKAFGLEFVKQGAGMSSGLLQIRNWRVWRNRPPPKRKKNLIAALAEYVGALVILGNYAPTGWKKEEKLWIMVIHLALLAP
jgi:hypothetical protein